MAFLGQLKRSFVGSFTGDDRGAPLDPTLPNDDALSAWSRDARHHGVLDDPTVTGRWTSPCGDRVAYTLRMDGYRIADVGVEIQGCGHTAAAAHYLAAQIIDRSMEQALEISTMDIFRAIPQLGEDHIHCGILALVALHKGLALHSLRETGHV